MKRARLGLLEVLGLVENAGRGGMCRRGAENSSLFSFGANKPLGFAIFLQADVAVIFCLSLFLTGLKMFLANNRTIFNRTNVRIIAE